MKAVILAAGVGNRMRPLTEKAPKCLLKVEGKAILDHQIDCLNRNGIRKKDLVVVTGYRSTDLKAHIGHEVTFIHNENYSTTNSLYSFSLAAIESYPDGFFLFNCDILFDCGILKKMLERPGNIVAVDFEKERQNGEMNVRIDPSGRILEINKKLDAGKAHGESVQIAKFNHTGGQRIFESARALIRSGHESGNLFPTHAYEELLEQEGMFAVDIKGLWWREIDTLDDYDKVNREMKKLK